jgi:hypothetical protein
MQSQLAKPSDRIQAGQKLMKSIVILTKEEACLYGHRTLERIRSTGKAEACLVVRGIDPEVYWVYLQKFFLDSWPNQPLQQTGPAITVFRGIMSSRAARLLSLPLRLSVKEKVLS